MTDRQCPYGHPVGHGAAFCTTCGTAVTAQPTACAHGHPVPAGSRFCPTCGVPIAPEGVATLAAPWPPPAASPPPAPVYAPTMTAYRPANPHPRPPLCTLAIVAFVLSLVWLYGLTSIAAIVVAIRALHRITDTHERGRPLAVWAIILGVSGTLAALGVLVAKASGH